MFNYPLNLTFKLIAFAPQVTAVDASGQTALYVRQKALALREDVRVFRDSSQQEQVLQINADRIIDFSAKYRITQPDGSTLGTLQRKGMRSLWSASYPIMDANGQEVGLIHEANPWIKVVDSLVGEVPFVGWLATMVINPSYLVELRGRTVLRLRKKPAFFEGRFDLEQVEPFAETDEWLVLGSVLMMLMLERSRG